jgi:two-component system sensor histidine kinase FlrB
MQTTPHLAPTQASGNPAAAAPARLDAQVLAQAFSEFVAVAAALEHSYGELQVQVGAMREELAERNRALAASLDENQRMRLALDAVIDAMPCGILVLRPYAEGKTNGDMQRRLRSTAAGASRGLAAASVGAYADAWVERMNPEARLLLRIDGTTPPVSTLGDLAAGGGPDLRLYLEREGRVEFALPQGAIDPEKSMARQWFEVQTRRMPWAAGGEQTILILRDISTRRQAEAEREQGRRAAALAEVAATLAHEIRNPLASLELFVDLLEAEPDRSQEWSSHLHAGLRTIAASVNNVLSFYVGGVLPRTQMPVRALVERAVAFVRPIVAEAGLELVFSSGEEGGPEWAQVPVCVRANAVALQQFMLNLVSNAVRHTPAGGSIGIRLERLGEDRVRIAVQDSGSGIAEEDLPVLFDPGWSGSGASPGLGLAVCARIAEQHAGRMTVESVRGHGAVFALEMPCECAAGEETACY